MDAELRNGKPLAAACRFLFNAKKIRGLHGRRFQLAGLRFWNSSLQMLGNA
jgi:hypothetical protein